MLGLSQMELICVIMAACLIAALSPSGVFTLLSIITIYWSVRVVRGILGPDLVIRFIRRVFPIQKIGSIQYEALVMFEVTGPQFDYSFFDSLSSYHSRFKDSINNKPEGFYFSIHFERREATFNKDKNINKNPLDTLKELRREKYLNSKQYFENKVFLITEKKWAKDLQSFASSCRLELVERPINKSFLNFEKFTINSGDALHAVDQSVHTFALKELPTEFDIADFYNLLNNLGSSNFTLTIKKHNSEKSIKRISFRKRRVSGFSSGASGEIEEGLSKEAIDQILFELISGTNSIVEIQAVACVFRKERTYELPFGALSSSFSKLKHLSVEELTKYNLGIIDRFISMEMTALEASALSPVSFSNSYKGNVFPNFYTPNSEMVRISGLREGNLPNGNAMVFAPSGKGKSMMLANLLASIIEETDTNTIILDSGYGFESFTKAYCGRMIEMTTDSNPVGINVLELFSSFENETYRAEMLAEFTRFITDPRGEISQKDLAKLRQAALKCDVFGGLLGWQGVLKSEGLEDIASNLSPWVRGGIYGAHFDVKETSNIVNSRVLYFTAPAVNTNTDNPLLIPYFFVVSLLVSSRASMKKKMAPSVVLWDEVAFLMKYAPGVVSSMWNCIRKTGSAVICCGQHPEQIMQYSCGEDILMNSPTRYLLGGSVSEGPLDRVIDINKHNKEFLRDRRAGDFFILSKESKKYFLNFHQSDVHYALFTTDKGERMEIDAIYNELTHKDEQLRVIDAAKLWVSRKAKSVSSAIASLVLFLGLTFTPSARADLFGGDVAVLGNILIQTIQQVLLITEQLDKAKNHYGKFKDIYEGNKRLLGDVKGKITDLKKKARGLKDWETKIKNVEEVLYIIDEIITRGKSVSGVVVGEAKNLSSSMELQKKLFLEAEELRMYVTATDDPEMLKNAGVKELTAHMAITQTHILKALNNLGDGSRESLAFQTREETEKIAKRASMENLNSTLMSFIGGSNAKSKGFQQKKRPY
ncbi:MAG: hypothetical protein R3C42_09995 [Parvularculaceae bacterium]